MNSISKPKQTRGVGNKQLQALTAIDLPSGTRDLNFAEIEPSQLLAPIDEGTNWHVGVIVKLRFPWVCAFKMGGPLQ